MKRPSLLIVDDQALFRSGLRRILEDEGFQLAGEAGTGAEALELAARLLPDVVLVDLDLPDLSGVELVRRLASDAPASRVLVFSTAAEDADVLDAVIAGANGHLRKDSSPDRLVEGVRSVAGGDYVISPEVTADLLRIARSAQPPERHGAELSERELDVLRLLAEGMDNREIADALVLSTHTVKHHVTNILVKLDVRNRIQAAVAAERSGLL